MQGPGDDFDLEVTGLNSDTTARHPLDDNPPLVPDRRDPTPRTSPRIRQWVRAAAVASVVLLAVIIEALFNPTLRSSLYTVFRSPTPEPSPTLAPDANLVLLESGAPWGTFSLDGQTPAPLSSSNPRLSAAWIRLASGHHTLRVTQPPFPALQCVISLPAARGDTCPLVTTQARSVRYFGPPPQNSRIIDLGARFDRLPPAAAAALVTVVRGRLSLPTDSVALLPGDHYLRDDGSVAVARTALRATLRLELASPDSAVPSDSGRCQSFCDVLTSPERGMETGGLWSLAVAPAGSWRVTTTDGQVVASHAPLFPGTPPYDTLSPDTQNVRLVFDVRWDGSWQISSQDGFGLFPSLRPVATQMANALLGASPGVTTSTVNIYDGRGLYAGEGWVISLTLGDPAATAPLYLYYHVGLLLAANDTAHRAFPGIPRASANEQAQARAILGLP